MRRRIGLASNVYELPGRCCLLGDFVDRCSKAFRSTFGASLVKRESRCLWRIPCVVASVYFFKSIQRPQPCFGFLMNKSWRAMFKTLYLGVSLGPSLTHPDLPSHTPLYLVFLARRWHRDRGLLYTAALGEGTFVRGISAGADDSRRVFVDHARKPCDTRVLESVEAGHTSHAVAAQVCNDLGITLPPIRVDGQCKYGLLSEGQVNRRENLVVYLTVEKAWESITFMFWLVCMA